MPFIDTHCHLDFAQFSPDRMDLIQACIDAGVERFVVPAIGQQNWSQVMALARASPAIHYGLGIHPHYISSQTAQAFDELHTLVLTRPDGLVAIGECGLDGRSHIEQNLQREFFSQQIELAMHAQLPLIVHSVRANDRVAQLLRHYQPPQTGVIHAFSGSYQQAKVFWQLDFRLGVGGVISFERAQKSQEAFKKMPLAALVLETDAPDMPLQGKQGQRNTPESILSIFAHLAKLRQERTEDVAKVLLENSRQLFPRLVDKVG